MEIKRLYNSFNTLYVVGSKNLATADFAVLECFNTLYVVGSKELCYYLFVFLFCFNTLYVVGSKNKTELLKEIQ